METILSVQQVSKKYNQFLALQDVSFTVQSGQIVGLLGPNGSGKTTLIKIINTLITNYTGQVTVCGQPLGVGSKNLVSYLPDVEFLPTDFKIEGALRLYEDFYQDFNRQKAIEMLSLVKLETNKRISQLSKGMKEKLQLVLTMSRRAKLYIFDEPIAGVDPAARDYILNTIISNYSEDAAILFSTHLISDVEPFISRAMFLQNGRIILDDEADNLRAARGKSIDQIFREEFKC